MATAFAKINPDILSWARERAQLSIAALAKKLKIPEEKLQAWEQGKKPPTFKQAQNFAKKTYVPFGYLFLKSPPEEPLPLPDLRTVQGHLPNHPSPELLEIVQSSIYRQEWYKEYLQEQMIETTLFQQHFRLSHSVDEIVVNMRNTLGVGVHPERGNWEDYYRYLVKKIESIGILVMRESFVKHWSRPLHVSEFRGFAIADNLAPVIFVNHADVPSARLFTLIHELAHIWLGTSGISDADPKNQRKEEIKCNAIAAEFLVPGEEFSPLWHTLDNWRNNLPELAAHFRVSKWVITRRALTLNKISLEMYQNYINEQMKAYREREKKIGDSGPSMYRMRSAQLSKPFSKAVIREAQSGKLLLRDAGQLLNIKPNKINAFAKELGI